MARLRVRLSSSSWVLIVVLIALLAAIAGIVRWRQVNDDDDEKHDRMVEGFYAAGFYGTDDKRRQMEMKKENEERKKKKKEEENKKKQEEKRAKQEEKKKKREEDKKKKAEERLRKKQEKLACSRAVKKARGLPVFPRLDRIKKPASKPLFFPISETPLPVFDYPSYDYLIPSAKKTIAMIDSACIVPVVSDNPNDVESSLYRFTYFPSLTSSRTCQISGKPKVSRTCIFTSHVPSCGDDSNISKVLMDSPAVESMSMVNIRTGKRRCSVTFKPTVTKQQMEDYDRNLDAIFVQRSPLFRQMRYIAEQKIDDAFADWLVVYQAPFYSGESRVVSVPWLDGRKGTVANMDVLDDEKLGDARSMGSVEIPKNHRLIVWDRPVFTGSTEWFEDNVVDFRIIGKNDKPEQSWDGQIRSFRVEPLGTEKWGRVVLSGIAMRKRGQIPFSPQWKYLVRMDSFDTVIAVPEVIKYDIISITLPAGYMIKVYTLINFGGTEEIFTSTIDDLGTIRMFDTPQLNWRSRIKSFRILPHPRGGFCSITIFEDINHGGSQMTRVIDAGKSVLNISRFSRKTISSFKVTNTTSQSFVVKLYDRLDGQGKDDSYLGDVLNMKNARLSQDPRSNWDNRVMSLDLMLYPSISGTVTFYDKSNYVGNATRTFICPSTQKTIVIDDLRASGIKWKPSSIRVTGNIAVVIYDNTGMRGTFFVIQRDVPNLGAMPHTVNRKGKFSNWNDRIRSMRIMSDATEIQMTLNMYRPPQRPEKKRKVCTWVSTTLRERFTKGPSE